MARRCHWRWLLPHLSFSVLPAYSQPASGQELIRSQSCDLSPSPRGARLRQILRREPVANFLLELWQDESGQDIAEYAVMLAVILVIVVGTIRLIGSNATTYSRMLPAPFSKSGVRS